MRRLAISAFLLLVAACDRQPEPPPTPAAPLSGGPDAQLRLVDASASSGLVFTHYAAVTGEFFIPEEMGPGVALFDADGDGDLDAYLVQGGRLAGRGEPAPNRLFRNAGDGTFTDATEQSGAGDEAYGMGVAAADFDNDGDTDLFVTNVGPDVLLANDGTGRFMDVTAAAGVAGGTEMSSSAVFVGWGSSNAASTTAAIATTAIRSSIRRGATVSTGIKATVRSSRYPGRQASVPTRDTASGSWRRISTMTGGWTSSSRMTTRRIFSG
jgi:hypothetical protein